MDHAAFVNSFPAANHVTTPATPPAVNQVITPSTTPKEFPFFEPIIYPPAWSMERAEVSSNYALLQAPGNTKDSSESSLEKLVADPTQPIVFLAKPVYEGLMEMAAYTSKTKHSEAAAYFIYVPLDPMRPHWEVIGWFMTGQKASGAEVEMVGSDLPPYMEWLKANHSDLMKWARIGHAHSHNNFSIFFSGTDLKQQYDRSQLALLTGDRLFLVVNAKKEIQGKYIQYSPVQFEKDKIALGLSFNNPAYLQPFGKADRKKVHDMVDALVEERKMVYGGYRYQSPYAYGGFYRDRSKNPDTLRALNQRQIEAMGVEDDVELSLYTGDHIGNDDLEPEISLRDELAAQGYSKKTLTECMLEAYPNTFTKALEASLTFFAKRLKTETDELMGKIGVNSLTPVSVTSQQASEARSELGRWSASRAKTLRPVLWELLETLRGIYASGLLDHLFGLGIDSDTGLVSYEEFVTDAVYSIEELTALACLVSDFEDNDRGTVEDQIDAACESAFEEQMVEHSFDYLACQQLLGFLNHTNPEPFATSNLRDLLVMLDVL